MTNNIYLDDDYEDDVNYERQPSQEFPQIMDGTETTKTCIKCEQRTISPRLRKLIVRTNSNNGSRFLGCSDYPRCRHTEALPQEMIMRMMGQKELFD